MDDRSGSGVRYGNIKQIKKGENIPEGAVALSPTDVSERLYKAIQKYEPKKDMWPFTVGMGFPAAMASITGILSNMHFRQQFRLFGYGQMASFGPAAIIPAITCVIVTEGFISQKILRNEFDCPTCAEVRAASLQTIFGWVQPITLGLFSSMLLARQRASFHIPKITHTKEFMDMLVKASRPFRFTAAGTLVLNLFVAMYVTREQAKASFKLMDFMEKSDFRVYPHTR